MGNNSRLVVLALCALLTTVAANSEEPTSENEIPSRQGKFGIPGFGGTTNLLSNIAKDLISKSSTSSQVLSLNLTNLVILLVLKAIIFGASTFGFGHHGRSLEQPPSFLSETELLLGLSYLKGDVTKQYGCLHRVACEDPNKTQDYLFAARVMMKGATIFRRSSEESKYESMVSDLQQAVDYGQRGSDCAVRYTCEKTR